MDFKTVVSSLMVLENEDMRGMKVTVETCLNMVHVLAGSEEDFVLFTNSDGEAFTIWRGEELTEIVVTLPTMDTYRYAYRMGGIETVLCQPTSIRDHKIVWERIHGLS